jgi:hypothetical protein
VRPLNASVASGLSSFEHESAHPRQRASLEQCRRCREQGVAVPDPGRVGVRTVEAPTPKRDTPTARYSPMAASSWATPSRSAAAPARTSGRRGSGTRRTRAAHPRGRRRPESAEISPRPPGSRRQ